MRTSRLVIALVLLLVGLVWFGQGIGVIGGSFMTGQPVWAVVGAACVAVSIALTVLERRHATGR
jgi:hypothetical protein